MFLTQSARVVFLPHEDARLVAQIEKDFVVGIVGRAHRIGAQTAQQHEVIRHGGKGQRAAVVRVVLVAAHPADAQRRAVQKNAPALDAHLAQTHMVDEVVEHPPVPRERGRHRVQARRLGRPGLGIGQGQFPLENALPPRKNARYRRSLQE